MQKKHPDAVVAISLSVDHDDSDIPPPEALQQEVRAKLDEVNINLVNVMAAESMDDVLARHDFFAIPAVLVYDRDGKLHQKFESDFTYADDIFPLVEELLKPAK